MKKSIQFVSSFVICLLLISCYGSKKAQMNQVIQQADAIQKVEAKIVEDTKQKVEDRLQAEKIDAELKDYQASLAQNGQDLMADLSHKDSLFVRDSAKLSESMKEIKRNELVALYQKVQSWNQQAQDLYQQKAQEKIAPLRNKALEAIRTVAKENGYSYVLDMNSVIVAPPGDDILPLVKKKLGIKDSPQGPPKTSQGAQPKSTAPVKIKVKN